MKRAQVKRPFPHESRAWPARTVSATLVGGIAIGTLFTLFVVPALYVLLAKDHARDREAAQAAAHVALPAA